MWQSREFFDSNELRLSIAVDVVVTTTIKNWLDNLSMDTGWVWRSFNNATLAWVGGEGSTWSTTGSLGKYL